MNPGQTCWIMRRGRVGVLPPAILLRDAGLRDFEVAPDVADRLIARDSGLTNPGRPK